MLRRAQPLDKQISIAASASTRKIRQEGATFSSMIKRLMLHFSLAAGIFAAVPARADGFVTAPVKASASSARLLSGGPARDGVYLAGVEIDLAPKTITYWRSPGEAGSPPVFDFSRSSNVGAVEVVYPAPKHIEEEGSLVAGYDARVIFPLRVTPRDPKAPVTLDLALDYAACGKICLPAKAQLSLALPQSGESPYAGSIADAEKRAPRKISAQDAKKLLALEKSGDKVWSLRWLGKGRLGDVFAEVSEPLFLESARTGEGFELKLFASGKAPAGPIAAAITVLSEDGAIEAPVWLE